MRRDTRLHFHIECDRETSQLSGSEMADITARTDSHIVQDTSQEGGGGTMVFCVCTWVQKCGCNYQRQV